MEPKVLKQFKSEVRKLHKAYASVVTAYNGKHTHEEKDSFPCMCVIETLLHNIGFDSSDSLNYDHDRSLEQMYREVDAIRAINEYCRYSSLTHFACDELSMLVEAFEREGDF